MIRATLTVEVAESSLEKIMSALLHEWRTFTLDPEATLPHDAEISISKLEGEESYTAKLYLRIRVD